MLQTVPRCMAFVNDSSIMMMSMYRQWIWVKANFREYLLLETRKGEVGRRSSAGLIGSAEQTFVFNYISDSSNNNCVASGTDSPQLLKWFSTFNRKRIAQAEESQSVISAFKSQLFPPNMRTEFGLLNWRCKHKTRVGIFFNLIFQYCILPDSDNKRRLFSLNLWKERAARIWYFGTNLI